MPFLTPLDVRAVNRKDWLLLDDLVYKIDGERWTVPAGFISDLASIPRTARTLLPVNDRHREAAVLHDWFYVTQPIGRKRADRIFLRAMEECGVGWLKRHTMYRAVRMGGGIFWRKRARALSAP